MNHLLLRWLVLLLLLLLVLLLLLCCCCCQCFCCCGFFFDFQWNGAAQVRRLFNSTEGVLDKGQPFASGTFRLDARGTFTNGDRPFVATSG